MADIKSTLELVMERTKHLTMSAEEKSGQQKKDFEKKLNGLLQQYEDKALAVDELMERISALQADLHLDDDLSVASAVVQCIQPGMDNAHWLALIERLAPAVVTQQLEQALVDYREKAAVLVRKGEQDHVEHLAREHDIQGSAVVPNLNKDAPIREELSAVKIETRERIDSIIQKSN
jgi:hypothetical protein